MAAQSANLTAVFNQIGIDYNALLTKLGNPNSLSTADKTSVVAAVNELKAAIDTINQIIANQTVIDDSSVSLTTTWSSDQITKKLQDFKDSILGGAGAAFDTLKEIEAMFASDASYATKVADALAKRVRVDAAQAFTVDEQKQACANIGIGDPTVDYVAVYTAAKA